MNLLINCFWTLAYYLAKVTTPNDRCNRVIYKYGKTMFVTHSIASSELDKMVKEFAQVSGLKMDWSFVGGRAVVQYVGSQNSLVVHQDKIKQIYAKYQTVAMEEANKTTKVTTSDGREVPFYSPRAINQRIESTWEFNQKYLN